MGICPEWRVGDGLRVLRVEVESTKRDSSRLVVGCSLFPFLHHRDRIRQNLDCSSSRWVSHLDKGNGDKTGSAESTNRFGDKPDSLVSFTRSSVLKEKKAHHS